jgi:hypothetical protein
MTFSKYRRYIEITNVFFPFLETTEIIYLLYRAKSTVAHSGTSIAATKRKKVAAPGFRYVNLSQFHLTPSPICCSN